MSILEAILLGVLQGLTEFLPVSSTAHLTLAGRALGLIDDGDPAAWTAFLAVVQLGTLVAVVAYFWRDLAAIARGFALVLARGRAAPPDARASWRLGWLLALGTIPIALVGLLLRDVIEGPLTKDLRVIAAALIGLALLLAVADRVGAKRRGVESLGARDALVVGALQVLSLVPGASRSGTTLTGGFFSGLTREAAARFSFLLSIPAIAASGLLEMPLAIERAASQPGPLVVATLAAGVSGYAAIWWLLRFLQRHDARVFVAYRVALGVAILALVAWGVL